MGFSAPPAVPFGIPWVPGRIYDFGSILDAAISTQAAIANTIYAVPILRPGGGSITQIGIGVTTAVAGTSCRCGICMMNKNGLPGRLILDAGTLDTSTTGNKLLTVSLTLPPTIVYGLTLFNGAPTVIASNTSFTFINQFGVSTYSDTLTANSGPVATFPFGPFPSDLSKSNWTFTTGSEPAIPTVRILAG